MKVLVDGAAGFVGRHVVEALVRRGIAVRATDAAELPAWSGVEVVRRDLSTGAVADLFAGGITCVIHAAGLFDLAAPRAALFATNVGLTRRMARAAALAGVARFVHVSSVTVHGRPSRVPVREDAPIRPGNDYERSKALGERALGEVRLPWVVLRPSGIYGPHGRYGLAAAIATMALAKARGRGHRSLRGGPRMTHVHVEDVAEAAVCLLLAPPLVVGRAFNVADDHAIEWGALMAELEAAVGVSSPGEPLWLSPSRARLLAGASRLAPWRLRRVNERLARGWRSVCSAEGLVPALLPRIDASAYDYWSADHVYSTSALRSTGFRVRYPDPRVGLRETIAWYRGQRWIP